MIQKDFALKAVEILKEDSNVIGLAVSGSWLGSELDEFSDLDLILVTRESVYPDKQRMQEYATKMGDLLNGFTGEHVGEPRLLICLYDNPLLHVDIKFLVPDEFPSRVEDPHILYDPEGKLEEAMKTEDAIWPFPGYQWMEDRFWIWLHYATTKLGRGEYFEALDFLSFVRNTILSPLMLIHNNKLPRGVRKVEFVLPSEDQHKLRQTVAKYDPLSISQAIWNSVKLYRDLRVELYPEAVQLQSRTETRTVEYFEEISMFLVNTGFGSYSNN